jgi:glucose/arabinose dehydrogenase
VDVARLSTAEATGADPVLPEPRASLVPTVRIAPARGWPSGAKPLAAPGTTVVAFASGLNHPRWLHVLPNGDVLVAETNAPPRPEEGKSVKEKIMTAVMKKAGAAGRSANRITLLRDADGDGVAETRSAFLEGLNSPFGMALVGSALYVANTDAVMRFSYTPGTTRINTPGVNVVELPAGPRNHHWTKNLIASPDGARLYVTVGSNSNIAEHGMQEEEGRAAVWEVDLRTGAHRIFASGLRNANGLAWDPQRGALWTVVNERDELGSDLVPDYLTMVREGAFYGWPYSYYGSHVDHRVQPQRPDLVAKAIRPDYSLGSHVAPLGLAFSNDGAFIGQHGSWNRNPLAGYNVVFVPFRDGRPSGPPVEVLGGFLSPENEAYGRPVGVAIDRRGALLVADDVGGVVWRVVWR